MNCQQLWKLYISPFPRQRDCLSYTLSFGFIATVKLQQREFPSYVTNLYYVSKLKYFTADSWHHSGSPGWESGACLSPQLTPISSLWPSRSLYRFAAFHTRLTVVFLMGTAWLGPSTLLCYLCTFNRATISLNHVLSSGAETAFKRRLKAFLTLKLSWQSTRVVLVWGTECNSTYHWTEQNWTEQNKRCVYFLMCILKCISTEQSGSNRTVICCFHL